MFYAKFNLYGSETSAGFANMERVAGFETRVARDAWVNINSSRIDVFAITAEEARRVADGGRKRERNGGHLADVVYLTVDNVEFKRAF